MTIDLNQRYDVIVRHFLLEYITTINENLIFKMWPSEEPVLTAIENSNIENMAL